MVSNRAGSTGFDRRLYRNDWKKLNSLLYKRHSCKIHTGVPFSYPCVLESTMCINSLRLSNSADNCLYQLNQKHRSETKSINCANQQTRQILDRLVGYKISPVLWEKLRNNHLSAGRVQSVALRMFCEREDDIEAFKPVEYWTISAELEKEKATFDAELQKYLDKKIELKKKILIKYQEK